MKGAVVSKLSTSGWSLLESSYSVLEKLDMPGRYTHVHVCSGLEEQLL